MHIGFWTGTNTQFAEFVERTHEIRRSFWHFEPGKTVFVLGFSARAEDVVEEERARMEEDGGWSWVVERRVVVENGRCSDPIMRLEGNAKAEAQVISK